jgi:hypothetical protein
VVDVAALKSAARAAIVMPVVFAFADKVIGQPQTSIFAAFGTFAMLVLTEFGGPPRARFLAYLGLGCVGAAFITVGTLCSRSPWLGAGAMAAVGFATLFSGVFGGYFSAAATGAILTFVLPVTIPAPSSAIPDRLEGWGLATGAAIFAVMLLWPLRRGADLQREAAGTVRRVADVIDAELEQSPERARLAREAVDGLGERLLRTQHRPTGPTGATAALASLPDELDWLLSFLSTAAEPAALELACAEDEEAMTAAAAVLRTSAERLEGRHVSPDLARLDAARDAVARALVRRLPELPPDTADGAVPLALGPPFRIRAVTYSVRQVGATHCVRREWTHRSSLGPTSGAKRRVPLWGQRSSSPVSTPACARSGSRTASAARPDSQSLSTSRNARISSTGFGWCSERCRCFAPTRSGRAGRFSARSRGPQWGSSPARCS